MQGVCLGRLACGAVLARRGNVPRQQAPASPHILLINNVHPLPQVVVGQCQTRCGSVVLLDFEGQRQALVACGDVNGLEQPRLCGIGWDNRCLFF